MKKVEQAEEFADFCYMFARENFGPVVSSPSVSAIADNSAGTAALDVCLLAIKWMFLYLPGTAAIHMLAMVTVLLLPYDDLGLAMLVPTSGILLVTTFMIMLGIGKLQDLRYLRVVGTIFASSVLFALSYASTAIFLSGDIFDEFMFCTLPVTVLAGYLAKRKTDRLPS